MPEMPGSPWLSRKAPKGCSARQLLIRADASRTIRPRGMHLAIRLVIFGVGANVADMRMRQRDQLTTVGRVGQDFLITGDGGIENNLTNGGNVRADGISEKQRAVFQGEQRAFGQGMSPESPA